MPADQEVPTENQAGTDLAAPIVNPGAETHFSTGGAGGWREELTRARLYATPISDRLHYDKAGSGRRRLGMVATIISDDDVAKWENLQLQIPNYWTDPNTGEDTTDEQKLALLQSNAYWVALATGSVQPPVDPGVSGQWLTVRLQQQNTGEDVLVTPRIAGQINYEEVISSIHAGIPDIFDISRKTEKFGNPLFSLFANSFSAELQAGDLLTVAVYPQTIDTTDNIFYVEAPIRPVPADVAAILSASIDQPGYLSIIARLPPELANQVLQLEIRPEGNGDNGGHYYEGLGSYQVADVTPQHIAGNRYSLRVDNITAYSYASSYDVGAWNQGQWVTHFMPNLLTLKDAQGNVLHEAHKLVARGNYTPSILNITYYHVDGETLGTQLTYSTPAPNDYTDNTFTVALTSLDENGNPDGRGGYSFYNVPFAQLGYLEVPFYNMPAEACQLRVTTIDNQGVNLRDAVTLDWPGGLSFDPTPQPEQPQVSYNVNDNTVELVFTPTAPRTFIHTVTLFDGQPIARFDDFQTPEYEVGVPVTYIIDDLVNRNFFGPQNLVVITIGAGLFDKRSEPLFFSKPLDGGGGGGGQVDPTEQPEPPQVQYNEADDSLTVTYTPTSETMSVYVGNSQGEVVTLPLPVTQVGQEQSYDIGDVSNLAMFGENGGDVIQVRLLAGPNSIPSEATQYSKPLGDTGGGGGGGPVDPDDGGGFGTGGGQ